MTNERKKGSSWLVVLLMTVMFLAASVVFADAAHGLTEKHMSTRYGSTSITMVPDRHTCKFGETPYITTSGTSSGDWVGIFRTGEFPCNGDRTPAIWWYYAGNTRESLYSAWKSTDTIDDSIGGFNSYGGAYDMNGHLPAGTYDLILIDGSTAANSDGYYAVIKRVTISIVNDYSVTLGQTSYETCGNSILVKTNYTKAGAGKEWIGLFKSSDRDDSTGTVRYPVKTSVAYADLSLGTADGDNVKLDLKNDTLGDNKAYDAGSYIFAIFTESSANDGYFYPVAESSYFTVNGHGTSTAAIGTAKAATCTEAGITAGSKCAYCKATITAQATIKALGHEHTVFSSTTAPKCGVQGYTTYKCIRCTSTEKRDYTDALEHSYVGAEWVTETDSTCIKVGKEYQLCKNGCKTKNTRDIPVKAHNYDNVAWITEKAATCTETGLKYQSCKYNCGTRNEAAIDPLGHTEVTLQAKAATCTATGLTEGKKCSKCGEITVAQQTTSVLGHAWGNWSTVSAGNCQTAGSEKRICNRNCGVEPETRNTGLNPTVHSNITANNAKAATCTTAGNPAYWHCSGCNKNFTDQTYTSEYESIVIPASGHSMGKFVTANKPTCTEAGNVAYYPCTTCGKFYEDEAGENYIEDVILSAKGHSGELVEAKEASCEADGWSEHYKCEACGKTFADEACTTPVNPLIHVDHNMTEHEAKKATCTEDGNKHFFYCSLCKKNYKDEDGEELMTGDVVIPAGHQNVKHVSYVEAKCLNGTPGNIEYYYCSACDKYYTDAEYKEEIKKEETVIAAKHDIKYQERTEATCTVNGNIAFHYCTRCNQKFTDETGTDLLTDDVTLYAGHDWKEATCTEPQTCQRPECGATFGDPLEHDWIDATCTEPQKCQRADCGKTFGEPLGHDWADATCTEGRHCKNCDEVDENKPATGHKWNPATCIDAPICDKCGASEGEKLGHKPNIESATCEEDQVCTRCKITLHRATGHTKGAAATCDNPQICTVCKVELAPKLEHKWSNATCYLEAKCTLCGEVGEKADHTPGPAATCTEDQICTVCFETLKEKGHKPGAAATCSNPQICTVCSGVLAFALGHTEGEAATCTKDKVCTVCGETIEKALGHTEITLAAKKATCTEAGLTEGKKCHICGDVLVEQNVIPATGHTVKTTKTTKATAAKDGKIVKTCACGHVISTTKINKIKSWKLSKTSVVYNGKQWSPTLTIKDSQGKKLKKGVDYKVSIPKYRRNVGKYKYIITFKGNYSGKKSIYLNITPKKAAIKKPVAAKKAVTVKWNKVTKQVTGYQIMVATNKKFTKGKKTVTVKGYKSTSKKITGLKAKKTYYVRVRTYKTGWVTGYGIKGQKTTVYSGWSTIKVVKTK